MGYHAINNGGAQNVYNQTPCSTNNPGGAIIGKLYNGEVFTYLEKTSYNTFKIKFLSPSGAYSFGFIKTNNGGNLAYSGVKTTLNGSTCYRFRLRGPLIVVNNSNGLYTNLPIGAYVYTTSATAGSTNNLNMKIKGYKTSSSAAVKSYDGYVRLYYGSGSMFNSNFCLYKA